jgi:hypothetical protein
MPRISGVGDAFFGPLHIQRYPRICTVHGDQLSAVIDLLRVYVITDI